MKKLSFLAIAYYGLLAIPFTQAATTNAFASTTTTASDQTTVTLTVAKTGRGTIFGDGINCGSDCSENFTFPTSEVDRAGAGIKKLTAVPSAGYYFEKWEGSCSSPSSLSECQTTYLTKSTTMTSSFKPIVANVKIISTHGKFTGSFGKSNINCSSTENTCNVTISAEEIIQSVEEYGDTISDFTSVGILQAEPDEGYQLIGWSGTKDEKGGWVSWGEVKNGATITAIFEPKYAVTVTKEGKGTVQGQTLENNAVNMGIMCGSDCNESYNKDTSLTLTATPDSGYIFKGWSGATCSGTGACTIKVTQPLNISALFESTTPTPTTTQPDPTKPFSASLSFAPLKQIYRPGDKLEVDLNAKLNAPTQFDRVDLWVVISAPHLLPKDHYLFMTPKPFEIFSTEPQALKFDLERLDQAVRVLTFDIIPGFGGQYTLFAAFVKSGKNPFKDGFLVLKSEIAIAEIIFTND